jgi:transcriptional regulator with XRE-family HTH domain
MVRKKGPEPRDRLIGARIRAIRTGRAGISLEKAAELAEWSTARLSRTERGLRHITPEEVATLLTAWRLPGDEREQVLAELQTGSSSGWWDRPIPGVPTEVGALASYEADASELVNVAITFVPGLLQTRETAVAVMAADGVAAEDIETRWMARLTRQQVLGKLDYTAYLTDTALTTQYGGPAALREQLDHLLKAQDAGREIRVLPARQTHVALIHPWLLMRFPNIPPVVHVELTNSGGFYIHGDDDVRPYLVALARLNRVALTQGESRKVISDLRKGL